ncbi:MAG: hypothetical protein A2W19_01425 [Spirochaetes bacterium RBG_16_49_21]|nr:MAG: hypothetical protein A2W19_01425 [Spirochaetes bacterium RBG_16_49_21]
MLAQRGIMRRGSGIVIVSLLAVPFNFHMGINIIINNCDDGILHANFFRVYLNIIKLFVVIRLIACIHINSLGLKRY